MKKFKIITVIVLSLAIIGILFFAIFNQENNIAFTPTKNTSTNYNNYIFFNYLDYAYDKFAFVKDGLLKSKLTVIDSKNNYKNLSEINPPFSIYRDKIIHLNKENLTVTDINTNSDSLIQSNVYNFMVYKDSVIFHTNSLTNNKTDIEKNSLYIYDLVSEKKQILYKEVSAFCINKDKLFIITKENMLIEMSLDSLAVKDIMQIDITSYPIYFIVYKEKIILQNSTNRFDIIDLNSKEITPLYISNKSYNNNKVSFICDDNNFYYSFQATKTDGSVVINTAGDNNGLWKVNIETLEKEKVLDETFNSLYLFEENLLFGIRESNLFRIDTTNKCCEKIN